MVKLCSKNLVFAVTMGIAIAVYSALKGSNALINTPDTVAARVDRNGKNEEPEYDVVIIGGGTAGCVLAARLSENPNIRVLLLEAGGSAKAVLFTRIPAAYMHVMHSKHDYNLYTEPQKNAYDVRKYWPRGKLLGGCSAINAMMFHAGAPTDYDEWAQIIGQEDWSDKEFRKYLLKFEKYTPNKKYPEVDPKLRGLNGPVDIGHFGYCSKASSKWMETCANLGIPKNPDLNTTKGTLGVTKIMTYIDRIGQRVTTESAYLTPEVLKRKNLKVAIYSTVTKIIFDTTGDVKKAVGVEFARSKNGPRYRVCVKKEVVLASGAIHSPHILMLSGIGPKGELEKHGIPVVHELPGVGRNLQDHAVVNTRVSMTAGHSIQHITAQKGLKLFSMLKSFVKWGLFGKGPMTTNAGETAAFVRTDDTKLFSLDKYQVQDEASSPDAPDIEAILVPVGYTLHGHGPVPPGELVTMGAVLLRPQSRGTISLKSSEPFDAPIIDPRYLDTQNDVAGLVRGLKLLIKIANTEPFASAIKKDSNPLLDHNLGSYTDEQLEEEVRKRVETLYHPTSTCRMAKLQNDGVVDGSLKVYGLENVRVADASIFPRIVAGHTTAPVIAIAEKAADIIKIAISDKSA